MAILATALRGTGVDWSSTVMIALLALMTVAAMVLIPSAPLGLITTAVQVLAGILLPSATVFALCQEKTGQELPVAWKEEGDDGNEQ